MTATPRELAHAAELRRALAELNNAALAARPFVACHTRAESPDIDLLVNGDSTLSLERLDAAIADAGELLSAVLS